MSEPWELLCSTSQSNENATKLARKVRRNVMHYNLDAILSAGYRVSSRNATLFRRWATAVLKAIESTLASKH